MNHHRTIACVAWASLLAGCATTDATRTSAYDDGHYAAAHDGYGDYYYDHPQFVTTYDPWSMGFDYGYGLGWYGAGYGPWGFGGWGPWYGSPWYWHHHHGWNIAGAAFHYPQGRSPQQAFPARRAGDSPRHESGIRAPRHDSEHRQR